MTGSGSGGSALPSGDPFGAFTPFLDDLALLDELGLGLFLEVAPVLLQPSPRPSLAATPLAALSFAPDAASSGSSVAAVGGGVAGGVVVVLLLVAAAIYATRKFKQTTRRSTAALSPPASPRPGSPRPGAPRGGGAGGLPASPTGRGRGGAETAAFAASEDVILREILAGVIPTEVKQAPGGAGQQILVPGLNSRHERGCSVVLSVDTVT